MLRPLRALTLSVMTTAALAAADLRGFDIVGLNQLDSDGVALATAGVVARLGDRQALADAARYDLRQGDLWLTGQVVYRQPGVRIAAARLGLHLPPGHRDLTDFSGLRGDAWEVEARVETSRRSLRLRAARVEISGSAITFHDVDLDLGYGAAFGFAAPKVIVTLRQPKPGEPEAEARSHIEGVALVSPTGTLVGLPVLWFPYLYRDFSQRYPWTQVRGGHTRRLGTYGRFRIGSGLPQVAGWRTGLEARVDDHSRSGFGYGFRPYWAHDTFGTGDAESYRMPSESVRGGEGDGEELQEREARFFDAQHRVNLGRGAVYGRYTSVPGGDVPGTPPDYRFMQDYLPERLENDPLPRRGATAAYGLAGVTATVDTERRIHPAQLDTERWFGVQAQLHPIELIGPLHAAAETWVEDLHQVHIGSDATRVNSRGWLGGGQWFANGAGIDADAGIKELRYADGEIAGVDQDAAARRAGFADAGLKLRFAETYSRGTHTFIPRVGIQLVGRGVGDDLPAYGFGDDRDEFEEDARYWVAGFDTALVSDRTLFHGSLTSRWAMREHDREYVEDGEVRTSSQSLADITGTFDGRPVEAVKLTASFTYDARPRQWLEFNTDASWRIATWLALTEVSTLVPDDGSWSHTPGASFYANRYRADTSVTLRPGGASIDGWLVQLTRRMVDGDLFLGFQHLRDEDGGASDERISIGFTLAGGKSLDDDRPQAQTSLSR